MELSSELAYKWNFIIKSIALIISCIITPIVTLLIYNNTSGIPGWSLEEFILLQGTFIFVLGIARLFMFDFPSKIISNVRRGEFDKFLLKPYSPLLYLTFSSIQIEGIAELTTGLCLIVWSFVKLNLDIWSFGFLFYLMFIALGILFLYSFIILISSLSFLIVNSYALFDLFFKLTDLSRYPASIYGLTVRFFVTFLLPLAILGYYPAEAMLRGANLGLILQISIPVILFFFITLFLWNRAMRKYSSAGG
ncbi:MAG: ABC-2 family transporter protein [Candidatus Nanoarchaeia archaeon]|nr:ABC-2 family transporter protein [Candidatus Nanoarchaeia archaeon]